MDKIQIQKLIQEAIKPLEKKIKELEEKIEQLDKDCNIHIV